MESEELPACQLDILDLVMTPCDLTARRRDRLLRAREPRTLVGPSMFPVAAHFDLCPSIHALHYIVNERGLMIEALRL